MPADLLWMRQQLGMQLSADEQAQLDAALLRAEPVPAPAGGDDQ